ncbi:MULTISPECIES: alpha-L-rhamnosidase [unclassified Microbacterium]|uniref:alpha-L-rhamnosidase n=1 Tax=unclassified Microbacterium TaxID=2609290 RepID=UPI0015FF2789|nr:MULTISPECIES: alpha-L-rhamnosidase [unclassified Microbacterium]MBT2486507.1 family 78 glycoside hydrolase catalytic domain [Microbacterium sp. ISL-108]
MTSPKPSALTVERLVEPLAVWTTRPRFGWLLDGAATERQNAYELEVRDALTAQIIAATGKVDSAQSHSVVLPDVDLSSRTPYTWRVRVWADDGEATEWSQSRFETTLLNNSEWDAARWVEPVQEPVTPEEVLYLGVEPTSLDDVDIESRLHPSPLVRQQFVLDEAPERARLYITAHGVYEVTVNGQQVTDEVLAPGYDEYQERLSYQTYDVTSQLRVGENVLGVRLADGWWAGRISFTGSSINYGDTLGVLWRLEGDRKAIATSDASARSSFGEIRYSDIFIGEKVDARLAVDGWDTVGFDDSEWAEVHVADGGTSTLVPFVGEPVRRIDEIHEPQVFHSPAGELLVDMGQNIAGRVRLTARGAAGTTITLEHTEALDRDGNFQQNVQGRNKDQTDVWVLAGTGQETFEPRFTYHGFRYVRVTGYPGDLHPEDVVGVILSSDVPQTGTFTTSDPRINQLHDNVVWSQRANFFSTPTDCPQRERAGWTGDIQVFARAATNNARVDLFLDRWLANVRAAQSDAGIVPMIVPNTPSFATSFGLLGDTSAGWGDAITIVPLALYERYGDRRVLDENIDAMRRWVDWIRTQAEQGLPEQYQQLESDDPILKRQPLLWNTGFHYGDWLVPSTITDEPMSMMVAATLTGALVASAYYYHSASNLAAAAEVLGDGATAREYRWLAAQIKDAFVAEYFDEDGRLSVHMQGAYVISLAFGLVPEGLRDAAGAHLVELIHQAEDHLDTGFLSVPHLLDVLVSIGERELAYTLLFQDTAPSWLYEVKMGATTIWESWDGIAPDGQPRDFSLNHYAFGAVDDWMYRYIAGITPTAPGYAEIEFRPDLSAPLDAVAASIETPFGRAALEWARTSPAHVEIRLIVPANTRAVLKVSGAEPVTLRPGAHTRTVTHKKEQ